MTNIVTRVKEAPDFIKDDDTGALINTNVDALQAYRRKKRLDQEQRIMAQRVGNLELKLNGIESMLKQILERVEK